MNQVDDLFAKLCALEVEINADSSLIKLHQQKVKKENMSFTGGHGRIWIQPYADGYDISLSGQSLVSEMSPFMEQLCGRSCNGYKQTNRRIGKTEQPFWRIEKFHLVAQAVRHYAKIQR
jgi:hypothetical protein